MVVVAIISIIAALAIPKVMIFMINARQAEAKSNLNTIYALQFSFRGDKERFGVLKSSRTKPELFCNNLLSKGTVNEIGFRITDCTKIRYVYSSRYLPSEPGAKFIAQAVSGHPGINKVAPGCNSDEWYINHNKHLVHYYTNHTAYIVTSCEYIESTGPHPGRALLNEDLQ